MVRQSAGFPVDFSVRKAMAQAVAFRFLFAESGYLLCIAAFCFFIPQDCPAHSPLYAAPAVSGSRERS